MKILSRGAYEAMTGRSPVNGPVSTQQHLIAGPPGTAAVPEVIRLRAENEQLRRQLGALREAAGAQVKKLVQHNNQLAGLVKTAYSPRAQGRPGQARSVGVPTHALRNPNIELVNGGREAPVAYQQPVRSGNPHDSAGAPGTAAQPVRESVRAAEDAIFYGSGDNAFYEGGENDN